ncbi:MAG: hypothetical protein DMG21_14015 [Acidobacteria bacterium]|nr:MAG: hypothetical protein DMG21_14015 [Acidobacteriota bacterium]
MRFTSLRAVILVALGFWLPSERGKAFEPSAAYQGANAEQTRTASPSKTSKAGAGSSEFFGRAKDLFAKGSLEEARQVARQGLALDPKNPVGYRLLGMIDVQEKDFSRAETAFKKSLELGPRSAEARNDLANCYLGEGKPDLAEKEFRAALALAPSNADAHYNLGLLFLSRRKPKEAIAHFLRVHPADTQTLFNLTQAYFAEGEPQKALESAERLSAQAKDNVSVHFTLGVLAAGNKQYALAARELEAADALAPATFEILFNLGQVYLRSGQPKRAEVILTRALKLKPDSAETLYYLAQAKSDQHRDLEALELLVKARKLAPTNTDIIFLTARISMNERFHEDAIPLLEEGLKLAPNRPDLHAALGECYFIDGKVDKALEEFQALIKLDPSARSYAFLALAYRNLGRFDEARKVLDEGLKLDPHNTACLFNLGYIASRQGSTDEAEKWFAQALAASPDYSDAMLELASIKLDQKKFAEAVPLLRHYIELAPHPAPGYYKLAMAERNLHQADAAERDLKIFQTLSKDTNSGAYPFQNLFDYLDKRAGLATAQQSRLDLDQLRQEVKIHPDQPQNLYLLASADLDAGQLDEAKQAIAQLDQLSAGDFRTAVGVGVLLARHRMYREAVEHFQTALKANPVSDDTWFDLADAYFRARDYTDALAAIEHISSGGQKDSSTLYLAGDIYAHLGQAGNAVDLFRQVIARNPDQDQAYLSLALTYLRSSDAAGAERALQEGLARTPDSGELYWGRGVLEVVAGKAEQAETDLRKSVDLLPEWPAGYSALGVLYYQTGQIGKARKTLKDLRQSGARGALDTDRIEQVLSAAPDASGTEVAHDLSSQDRQQFLQIALSLADQTL